MPLRLVLSPVVFRTRLQRLTRAASRAWLAILAWLELLVERYHGGVSM